MTAQLIDGTAIAQKVRDGVKEKVAKRIAEGLRSAYLDELLAQYVTQLESDLGITVNESALAQVFGGGGTN